MLSTTNWHLPSTSTRIKSCWLSTIPERNSGWRAEKRHSVLWEKLAEQVFRWLNNFTVDFMSPVLVSPYIQRSPKVLHGDDCFWWLGETFCQTKENVFDCNVLPLYQNHIYTDLPLYLFGAVSQSYLRCYLLGYSPHFAPIKLNSQHLR